MDGKSLDILSEKFSKLKELYPEAFTEDKIDWEKLKAVLGDDLNFSQERYHLNWAGKSEVFRVLQQRTSATLIPDKGSSVNYNSSENIFIEGENLEVLKVLQKSYFGKIKMIYIDPPYNTGSDSFIYPDRFSESKDEYLKRIGDKDEEGFLLKEGMFRKNSKDSGHYHSNWLSMMYPRLYLARNLLSDDGVIFVSIDDNEVHNLRMIMNEIFGEENFIAQFVWHKKYGGGGDNKNIVGEHEYILSYSKGINPAIEQILNGVEYDYDDFADFEIDENGNHFSANESILMRGPNSTPDKRPNLCYPIIDPDGNEIIPRFGKGTWAFEKKTLLQKIESKELIWKKVKGNWMLYKKQFLFVEDEVREKKPRTILDKRYSIGQSGEGTNILKEIFEKYRSFSNPKPVSLIKHLIYLASNETESNIILDFFAGSGTTAHAVMELNKEDGGNRKFILVQLPEKTDENSEAYKAGYRTIADICQERIRRVIKKLSESSNVKGETEKKQTSLDFDKEKVVTNHALGYRAFKLYPSNFKIWRSDVIENGQDLEKMIDIFDDQVKPNSEKENMLYELILKSGYKLTEDIIQENNYYSVANSETVIALESIDAKIIESILKQKPKNVIALDKLFEGNDQLKTNTALQMKDANIEFRTV